mmetsp:Transcript_28197/g.84371  ORF Transcript_28197/g.84371 Transcript_28197/m.84371 type:complete len:206 (+) Transcript_28197:1181-1798(+)
MNVSLLAESPLKNAALDSDRRRRMTKFEIWIAVWTSPGPARRPTGWTSSLVLAKPTIGPRTTILKAVSGSPGLGSGGMTCRMQLVVLASSTFPVFLAILRSSIRCRVARLLMEMVVMSRTYEWLRPSSPWVTSSFHTERNGPGSSGSKGSGSASARAMAGFLLQVSPMAPRYICTPGGEDGREDGDGVGRGEGGGGAGEMDRGHA